MNKISVVVVGGGVGGLSTACYLANAGTDVTLVEKNEQLGGLASELTEEGFHFDTGPTWYMMPEVIGRFFKDFGRSPADYYWLRRLHPSYRVYYKDGDSIDVTTDQAAMLARFENREPGQARIFASIWQPPNGPTKHPWSSSSTLTARGFAITLVATCSR